MTLRRESGGARFVDLDEEKCRSSDTEWCDWGKAYSMWQLHRMKRTESRAESARIAAGRYRQGVNFCGGSADGGISMFATGKTCSWPEARERAAEMRSIQRRLCR